MNSLVDVHNEWDPVEEIIVGTALYGSLPSEKYFELTVESDDEDYESHYPFTFPQKIIDETEEDIDIFINELKKLNIIVRRPEPIKHDGKFKTLDWESEHYFCYCPRDLLLAIGNTVIECPSGFRSRYFETFSYRNILMEYFKSGTRSISAPKPRLLDSNYNYQRSENETILKESEPLFDAANVLRAGKDIFYLVSDSGNELGGQWLKSLLGDKYNVHLCRGLYSGVHFDTTICFIRPGLLLLQPDVNPDNLPPILKKWEIITAPEMVPVNYSDLRPMTSEWLGMNFLMLSPTLAAVDKNQTQLIRLLEKKGVDVLPILLRHGKTLGGGTHCITLDTRRKGTLESYF